MVLEVDNIFEVERKGADEFFVQEAEEALRPRTVIKQADETISDIEVPQDDDELFMSVSAQTTYKFKLAFIANGTNSADMDMLFSVPAESKGKYWMTAENDSRVTSFELRDLTESPMGSPPLSLIGGNESFELEGFIITGNNTGNLQWKWSQNNDEVSDLIIRAGSYLEVTRQ